jgi:serine/threonine protein kinase
VRIVDFGIAKALAPSPECQNLTSTAELFGSPYYMSPEQALGRPLDARSDVYSLGCVMYECMTFTLPLASNTPFNTLKMHVSEKPMSISERCPNRYSHELQNIVMKCLAKDPARRFQSMADLKHALDVVPEVLNESRKLRMTIQMTARPAVKSEPAVPAKSNILSFSKKRTEMLKLIVLTACVITMVGGVSAFCLSQFNPKQSKNANDGLDSAISRLKNMALKPKSSASESEEGITEKNARDKEDDADLNAKEMVLSTSKTDTLGSDTLQFRLDHKSGESFTRELKKSLKNKPDSSLIFISNCNFDQNALDCLKGHKSLTTLNMIRCHYPEETLAFLRDMPRLSALGLTHGKLSDDSMKYLVNLKRLKVLDLTGQSQLTAKALEHLPPTLEDIHLRMNGGLSRETFGVLARYKKLQSLDLGSTRISDAGLVELKRLPALQNIELTATAITDDGVDALLSMPKLKMIELTDSHISREGLLKLAHAPNLREIAIYSSDSLTEKDFEDFRRISKTVKLTPDRPNRHHDNFGLAKSRE